VAVATQNPLPTPVPPLVSEQPFYQRAPWRARLCCPIPHPRSRTRPPPVTFLGVCRGWAANRKRALTSADGLALTQHLLVTIGKVNQMSAQALVASLGAFLGWQTARACPCVGARTHMA
jgi:hypothetical protein